MCQFLDALDKLEFVFVLTQSPEINLDQIFKIQLCYLPYFKC